MALLAASASDVLHRRVPNTLNGTICAVGLVWQLSAVGYPGLLEGALGVLAAFVLVIGPFAMGLYRGGDAKLVMALGAFLGPRLTIWMFVWGVAFGGVLAVVVFATAGRAVRQSIVENLMISARTATRPEVEAGRPARLHVPMAVAFAAGAVVALGWR